MIADIDIAITSWPNCPRRLGYFTAVVEGLLEKLRASRHSLRYVVSAETQPLPGEQWCGDELAAFCELHDVLLHWRNKPPSMGGNCNDIIGLCDAPLIFMQQDDWLIRDPLDLSPGADLMLSHDAVDITRYCYGQGPNPPEFTDNPDGWRRFLLASPWPYGMDPHMIRRTFCETWGPFYDEANSVACEGDMLWRLVNGKATVVAADHSYFHHRGHAGGIGDHAAVLYKERAAFDEQKRKRQDV